MEERHFPRGIGIVPDTSDPSLYNGKPQDCSNYALPVGGVITLQNGDVVTLTEPAVYRPKCTPTTQPAIIANGGGTVTVDQTASDDNIITDLEGRDPFYASTFPQVYALAATTVIAYTLVIMLFVTPRSFLDGGVVILGRKGFTNGGSGGTNIGGRPWLQKVAALTVAISLTIATSNTFSVAENQYNKGFQSADLIQSTVLGGTELKVIRIISDTFLWLAQAQTLIRLFPRQREKIIIKWAAFALITLDLIFQCLNSFVYTSQGNVRPKNFTDAVPALSYLFQLSLGVLYAAWVIYYSLMKKRYAFYHPQMKNVCVVAVLSIMAILVPVVFFILDISKPEFTGWGDYVRWVGAAAASVIVWEWVERIEALEREEKKDGILGREVFDGDEMLDVMPGDYTWPRRRKTGKSSGSNDDGETGSGSLTQSSTSGRRPAWPNVSSITTRYRSKSRRRGTDGVAETRNTQPSNHDRMRFLQPPLWPSRPPPAVTPVSRTDTPSAASTVYAVRYRPLTETTSRTPDPNQGQTLPSRGSSPDLPHGADDDNRGRAPVADPGAGAAGPPDQDRSGTRWRALAKGVPFPRISRGAQAPEDEDRRRMQLDHQDSNRWDLRARLEEFAVSQAEKIREKMRPSVNTDSLPVTVVPAPPRRGAALAQLLEEQELETLPQQSPVAEQRPMSSSQRRGSGGLPLGPTSPATGEFPHRQPSSGSRSRPAPVPSSPPPQHGVGRSRNRQLSITIVPAPPRETTSAQGVQRPVLGRQVSDLGRQVPDEETRD